jgi:thymidylate kinase
MKSIVDKKRRGLLIIFEGVDRAGKSTQVELLKNYFLKKSNENCEKMAFPGKIFLNNSRPRNCYRKTNK